MIKTAIFDLDGTIVDTLPIALKAVNRLSGEYGYSPLQDSKQLRRKDLKRIIKEDLQIPFYLVPSYASKIKKMMLCDAGHARIVSGIKLVLNKLSKKYKVLILTSNSRDMVEGLLRKNNINSISKIYSDSSIFGKDKVIKRLLRELNEKKEEVVYIGDEIRDIVACQKIGMRIIAVTWGYNSKESLEKCNPDYLVDKPKNILEILN